MPPTLPKFDEFQFADRVHYPVSAHTSIAFSDYGFMHTQERKLATCRTKQPLLWAHNDTAFRELLVRYLERRAFVAELRCREAQVGTQQERLSRAVAKLRSRIPQKVRVLTGLCKEFVAEKANPTRDAKRLRELSMEIKAIDGEIRFAERPAEIITGVRFFYYGVGCDSVEVANRLGLTPWGVRQLIWKLDRIWKKMESEQQMPGTRPGKCAR